MAADDWWGEEAGGRGGALICFDDNVIVLYFGDYLILFYGKSQPNQQVGFHARPGYANGNV
ncbi:hypothetical protein [Bergeriella denitrificans]|uniref:hypothetical protein n=1 Tax=Bergeriella denitrificans TaxID=494 RepID=UPI00082479F1|nr:hypothetical protein [Bergeriella denitrificans]